MLYSCVFSFSLTFFFVQIIVIFINFNLLIGSMCLQMRCATMKSFVALLKVNGAGTYSICFLNLNFLSFCHVVFHVFRFVLCSLEGVKLFRLVLHIILWVNQLSLSVMLIIFSLLDIVVSSLMIVTRGNQGSTFSTLGLV